MRPLADYVSVKISTHAPAGGATFGFYHANASLLFLLTPLREGRPAGAGSWGCPSSFLLTPLREGRQNTVNRNKTTILFLLTPLREGRHGAMRIVMTGALFLLTPLREGRRRHLRPNRRLSKFLLTPLREGRQCLPVDTGDFPYHFYSRPCGRGDSNFPQVRHEVLRQIAER